MTNKEYHNQINDLKERICKDVDRYGKNQPMKCWQPDSIKETEPSIWKCLGNPKTLFTGRFCAVSGFIFAIVNGKYSILTNLRGSGTPDYQGCWNAPCGFLECFETSKEGIQREIFEECGFYVHIDDLNPIVTETDPKECNNGNVTVRHRAFLGKINPKYSNINIGGEENEVDNVKWIPIDDIDNYKWAFNHRKTIEQYAPSKMKRKLIEFYYKYFKSYNSKYTIDGTKNSNISTN